MTQKKFTYIRGYWYIIVVNYVAKATSIDMTAWVYNEYGDFLISISASSTSPNRFTPAYIGVFVDNPTAQFDDFIISTIDPRSILFTGFYSGMRVEVWDNLGNLVNSTTAPASSFPLGVTTDIVVGTGVDGRIVVRYPDGSICIDYHVPSTDAILGGDTYRIDMSPTIIEVILGANRTSATISANISANPYKPTIASFIRIVNNDARIYYARLILSPQSSLDQLTANISLVSGASATAMNITVVNGAVISDATSWITIGPSTVISAVVSAHFPSTGRSATLYILLEYSTLSEGQGATVYYPIELNLNAASISASSSTTYPIEQEPYRAEEAQYVNDV